MLTLIPREEQWRYRDINKDEAIWRRAATEAAIESGEDEFSRDLNALVFEQSYTIEDQTRLLDENSIRETKDELDRIVEMANQRSKYNEEALSIQKEFVKNGSEFMAKIDKDPNTGLSHLDVIKLNRQTIGRFMDQNLIQRQPVPTFASAQNYNPFGELRISEL